MTKVRSSDQIQHKFGEQSEDNPFTFVMSSEAKDRTGDIIRQSGWDLGGFKRNPIALFAHEHSFPIGTWKNVRVEGRRLLGDLVLAAQGTSERIDEIRSLLEQRILKAVSVGFRVREYEPIEKNDPWGAWDITKSELLETSVVSVPAHQDALMAAKSLGISKSTQNIVFDAVSGVLHPPRHSGEKRQSDYSHLTGEPSDLVRVRRDLARRGQI